MKKLEENKDLNPQNIKKLWVEYLRYQQSLLAK